MSCRSTHASIAVGVGSSEKESGSSVRRADIGRSYNRPFAIEPDAGKVGEDSVESQGKVSCDILTDDEARSKYANCVKDRGPEVPRVMLATLPSRLREGLAWVATDDDVDRLHPSQAARVGVDRHAGPVPLEHRPR